MKKKKNFGIGLFRNHRMGFQGLAALMTNPFVQNFPLGKIYSGEGKRFCSPGLNCYSCPGAAGSCPIGAFQAVVGSLRYDFSYYIFGTMALFGVLVGRLICGFLCPFGLVQEILHKIPSKKFSTEKLWPLKLVKYFMLFVVVFLMGVFLTDQFKLAPPYFCKYVCPQGILEGGIPLSLFNEGIRNTLGKLFLLKGSFLVLVVILSIFTFRPFCKWICPLGAFYAFFNKISFFQYKVDQDACIHCGKCRKACGMEVDMSKNQTALECIRCGECVKVCPTDAISTSLDRLKENAIKRKQVAQ
jgi:conserved protein, putative ferredoxin-type protein napH